MTFNDVIENTNLLDTEIELYYGTSALDYNLAKDNSFEIDGIEARDHLLKVYVCDDIDGYRREYKQS